MANEERRHTIPEEMVEEIMSFMEPIPLLKFKSVSKGMNKMISSKYFGKKQLMRMKELNRLVFILQPEFCFVPLFYDNMVAHTATNGRLIAMDDKSAEIVASSNGLVLFCNLNDEFFLMNPTTTAKHMLPVNKILFPDGSSWAQVFFGMGYANDIDDYKVLRIVVYNNPTQNTDVMVYSRNSGKWLKEKGLPHDFPVAQPGVYVHGRLHWRSAEFCNQNMLTSFNISSHEYSSMCIPETPLMFGLQQLIALDDETLAISFSVMYTGGPYILWVLKDYFDPNSWTKVAINTSTILNTNTIINLQPIILLKPNGSTILFRLDPLGMFAIYDMESSQFTLIDSEVIHEGFCTVYNYVPCLHSPAPSGFNEI